MLELVAQPAQGVQVAVAAGGVAVEDVRQDGDDAERVRLDAVRRHDVGVVINLRSFTALARPLLSRRELTQLVFQPNEQTKSEQK